MSTPSTGPFTNGVAITKSDTVNLSVVGGTLPQAIYVGGAGVVAVVFEDGSVANFTCVAGQILPVIALRVNAANTTATLLVALYAV